MIAGCGVDRAHVVVHPCVQCTLWGAFAANPGHQLEELLNGGAHPVVAIKSARVGDFSGKNLSTVGSSMVEIDPDVPQAGSLRHW